MALVFFGPRKLPQISRSLGKNLAEFRRASEDFRRTWDREVSLEDSGSRTALTDLNSSPNVNNAVDPFPAPSIAAIAPDQVIARNTISADPLNAFDNGDVSSQRSDVENQTDEPKHSPKNDWL